MTPTPTQKGLLLQLHRMLPNLKDDLLLLDTSRLLPFSTILDRRIEDRPVSYDDVEKKELL